MDLIRSNLDKEEIKKYRKIYGENISEMDLIEEIFVSKFGYYIIGTMDPDLNDIFRAWDKIITDSTETIFNTSVRDIKTFYKGNIYTIFCKFSSEISELLQNDDALDFAST